MRNKWVVVSIVVWSLVLVVAVGAFTTFFIQRDVNLGFFVWDFSEPTAQKEEIVSQDVRELDVDWVSGDIRILKSEDDSVRIVQQSGRERDLFTHTVNGARLSIQMPRRFVLFGFFHKTYLEIYLPEKEYTAVNLSVVSCNVSGEISAAQRISVDTVSGDITLSGDFGDVDTESVSGNIELSGMISSLDTEAVSGSVRVQTARMLKQFRGDFVSGEITLILPENDGFSFTLDKVSGKLSSDFELSQSGDTYRYKNGGSTFSADVVSGNVNIRRLALPQETGEL